MRRFTTTPYNRFGKEDVQKVFHEPSAKTFSRVALSYHKRGWFSQHNSITPAKAQNDTRRSQLARGAPSMSDVIENA